MAAASAAAYRRNARSRRRRLALERRAARRARRGRCRAVRSCTKISTAGNTARAAAASASPPAPGPTTTAMRSHPASTSAASAWASIERPATSCSGFGRLERMRVPSPAASSTPRQERPSYRTHTPPPLVMALRALARRRVASQSRRHAPSNSGNSSSPPTKPPIWAIQATGASEAPSARAPAPNTHVGRQPDADEDQRAPVGQHFDERRRPLAAARGSSRRGPERRAGLEHESRRARHEAGGRGGSPDQRREIHHRHEPMQRRAASRGGGEKQKEPRRAEPSRERRPEGDDPHAIQADMRPRAMQQGVGDAASTASGRDAPRSSRATCAPCRARAASKLLRVSSSASRSGHSADRQPAGNEAPIEIDRFLRQRAAPKIRAACMRQQHRHQRQHATGNEKHRLARASAARGEIQHELSASYSRARNRRFSRADSRPREWKASYARKMRGELEQALPSFPGRRPQAARGSERAGLAGSVQRRATGAKTVWAPPSANDSPAGAGRTVVSDLVRRHCHRAFPSATKCCRYC